MGFTPEEIRELRGFMERHIQREVRNPISIRELDKVLSIITEIDEAREGWKNLKPAQVFTVSGTDALGNPISETIEESQLSAAIEALVHTKRGDAEKAETAIKRSKELGKSAKAVKGDKEKDNV